jgi:hypothetical protein
LGQLSRTLLPSPHAVGVECVTQSSKPNAARSNADAIRQLQVEATKESDGKSRWNLEQLQEAHKVLFARIEAEKVDLQIPKPLVQITDFAHPAIAPIKPERAANIFLGLSLGHLPAHFLAEFAYFLFAGQTSDQKEWFDVWQIGIGRRL